MSVFDNISLFGKAFGSLALGTVSLACTPIHAEDQWLYLPHVATAPSAVLSDDQIRAVDRVDITPVLVRDITKIRPPETLGQAADSLPELFRPDDYRALMTLYGVQNDVSSDQLANIEGRIEDIHLYIYNGWAIGEGESDLSKLLQCSIPGPQSVDMIILLAVNFHAGDTDSSRDYLVSVSNLLSDRLRSKCLDSDSQSL